METINSLKQFKRFITYCNDLYIQRIVFKENEFREIKRSFENRLEVDVSIITPDNERMINHLKEYYFKLCNIRLFYFDKKKQIIDNSFKEYNHLSKENIPALGIVSLLIGELNTIIKIIKKSESVININFPEVTINDYNIAGYYIGDPIEVKQEIKGFDCKLKNIDEIYSQMVGKKYIKSDLNDFKAIFSNKIVKNNKSITWLIRKTKGRGHSPVNKTALYVFLQLMLVKVTKNDLRKAVVFFVDEKGNDIVKLSYPKPTEIKTYGFESFFN